ncbi:MAG: fimbrial protein [Serratia sp. (in: enterobacteria)]|uniref:fimbrial protein n=1 Tax=Serratia sp. (in: enterobacteria) TaxID=616 RepID=UPI003F3758ED
MDMKGMFKATALCLALGGMGFTGFASANVTLNINGTVKASPCQVVTDGKGNIEVQLNGGKAIEAASMANPQSHTDFKEFSLTLKDCPAATTKVTATFTGDPADEDIEMYKNSGGDADAIQIHLTDKGETRKLGTGSTMDAPVVADVATFDLKARAYTAQGGVKPGSISTAVQVGFVYH